MNIYIPLQRFFLSVLFLLACTTALPAQGQTMEWSAESHLVTVNGTKVEIMSNLSVQGTSLVWEQTGYNTSSTSTFNIVSASGSWDAQEHLGELSYGLEVEGSPQTATLTVSGTAEGIAMALAIHLPDGTDDSYIFLVDTDTLTNL